MVTVQELKLCLEVASGTEELEIYVPPSGAKVRVITFASEGPYSENSVTSVKWDGDYVWAIKGSGKIPFEHIIPASDCDGIKELSISMDNGEAGNIVMSAYAKLMVET